MKCTGAPALEMPRAGDIVELVDRCTWIEQGCLVMASEPTCLRVELFHSC